MKCGFNLSLCAQQFLKPRYNVFSPLSPASTGLLKPHRYHLSTKATPIATMSQEQPQEPAPKQEEEQKLPPLSPQDFRAYNQKAEQMEYFHAHFRHSWNILWDATTAKKRPSNMTLKQFINVGLQFAQHLEVHHSIEENHVFPYLARRMPEFQAKGRGKRAAELLRQHRQIHDGLEGFEKYLEKCVSGEEELRLDVLREKMEGWREVLWTHLDQEVKTLGAENMRRYWSKEEIAMIPM
ncbi:hypothetical protein ASPCAL04497 [Aspergillus calidoustus]|uniref:Hemerythrin-like domain-containing protein n=1 Tax=Aspergillus calidoustus TaxID=454130 RepID=A0A0U5FXH0_ASPCI|nr:hypothetical protein ASPCAL04497 [Aspergillus calidoustus]